MIEHFKNQPEQYTFGGLTNAEVVDYLERHKEPSSYSTLEITDVVRKALQECEGYKNCRCDVYAARVGAVVEGLLREQQLAEWNDSIAKEMFIKALERAIEQTKKGYELTDCDKHSWWEDFKAYSGINPAEWSKEDKYCRNQLIVFCENCMQQDSAAIRCANWLKSLHPQPKGEIYKSAIHDLAIRFRLHLDENRPDGKMSLSSGECEDIDKAFRENDWAKIIRYVEKYSPSWKPSEEQMKRFKNVLITDRGIWGIETKRAMESLYADLEKL